MHEGKRTPKQEANSSLFTTHYKLVNHANARKATRVLTAAGVKLLQETASGWIVLTTRQQIEKLTGVKVKETTIVRILHHVKQKVVRRSFAGRPSDAPPPLDTQKLGK